MVFLPITWEVLLFRNSKFCNILFWDLIKSEVMFTQHMLELIIDLLKWKA